jgi:glycosyltransferase involved in cell wall biosynthesis
MKKICFLSLNDVVPFGGSEDLWYQTALHLFKLNYKIFVIFYDWKDRESKHLIDLEKAGIKVIRVPFLKTMKLRVRKLMNPLLGDMLTQRVDSVLRRLKPDLVIFTTTAPTGSEIIDGVRRQNIPYLINVQLADELIWKGCDPKTINCYKSARAIYFLASKNRNATEKQLGFRFHNAKRHFNPIKTTYAVKELSFDSDVIHFACVGRMGVEHKRQDLILEVLSSEKWKALNWNLHFYGKGEHENSLRRLTEMYELTERVFFHGYIEDVDKVWQKCHALLLPSTYEGVPMAVTEAMKCQRIVIVTNVGFAADFVEDGVNGFKAESATYNEYKLALERAWENRHNWKQIACRAKETIEKNYPKDAAAFFAEQIVNEM